METNSLQYLEDMADRLQARDNSEWKRLKALDAVLDAIQEDAFDGWWKLDLSDNSVEFCKRWSCLFLNSGRSMLISFFALPNVYFWSLTFKLAFQNGRHSFFPPFLAPKTL